MNTLHTTAIALTITAGLLTGDARADHAQAIDELSFGLMRQTAAAAREVRYGFRRTPQFKHLYEDVCEMYTTAKHIHDVAHVAGSRQHILSDVEELDELGHHVEELIEEMSGPGNGHATHGRHGYGQGRISQFHLRRLNRLMHGIVETVHELEELTGDSRSNGPVLNGPPVVVPPVAPPAPVAVPRSPVFRRSGFEIRRSGRSGRLSFSLRIR
ncbi:MAG: hypothetical protein HON53_14120 [Planctomycetaceae bacterium]|jgi:hypothetical protein|nr:hypothetical protein [Planctomycetaceae bacterium]MBT6157276.1 hypothetical protein [Planctomycetaceae bacterium]MBT6486798.1 hypothetical protein [Planctomycetaceae bacterium]MBT6493357.1 hypothetical protein [Planctomycetaceae bacterium]